MTVVRFFLALLLAVSAAAASAAPATVLMRVGDVAVTEADVRAEIERAPAPARAQALSDSRTLHFIVRNLMARRLLAREAQANGLAATPAVQAQLALASERLLSEARLQQFEAQHEPDAAALEAYARSVYAAQGKERFTVPALTHARHILIEGDTDAAKAEADKLRAELRAGASFEELAKEHSQDKGSAARGGDLGEFPDGKMVPEFDGALKALKNPGDISEPVKTQFGWHLIELVGRTPARERSFDEVKDDLMREGRVELVKRERTEMTMGLLKDAKLDDAAIGAMMQTGR